MRTAVWTGALAVSLLSMPVRPVAAQDPPFERIQMTTIVVKPGMTSAFEAEIKLLNEARAKAKDPVARSFWQAGRGGPPRTYYSVVRFNKWAELEALTMNSDVLAKAFGEREAVRIGDAMGDTIESAQSEVMTVWKGMSSWKDGTWAYAWLTESQRAAGEPPPVGAAGRGARGGHEEVAGLAPRRPLPVDARAERPVHHGALSSTSGATSTGGRCSRTSWARSKPTRSTPWRGEPWSRAPTTSSGAGRS